MRIEKDSVIGISALLVMPLLMKPEQEKNLIKDFIRSYLEDIDTNEILKKLKILRAILTSFKLYKYYKKKFFRCKKRYN